MNLRASTLALAAALTDQLPVQHKPQPAPLAYPIADLPAVVGVGRSFLYEQIKAGKLKATKVGRRTAVLDEDARAWLRSLRDGKAA